MAGSGSCEMLSASFSLRQLCVTHQHDAHGKALSNFPVPDDIKASLTALCRNILEKVQLHYMGKKVVVNSGYRCPAVNKAVGSKPTSQHMLGEAADIHVEGVPHVEVADWIASSSSGVHFGQLILENYKENALGPGSGWVHVSLPCKHDARHHRGHLRQKLILPRGSGGYLFVPGTYADILKLHPHAVTFTHHRKHNQPEH